MSNLPEEYQEPTDQDAQDRKEAREEERANADWGNEPDTI